MSKRNRFLIYALISFVICVTLVLAMAYGLGQDPFNPQTLHIWALSLIAAIYASIRLAMIAEKVLKWEDSADGSGPKLKSFGFGNKKEHDIDRRMAARRERVEAAKSQLEDTDTPKR